MVADWQATIDALRALDEVGDGPLGYWGLSMGTIYGVPLVAAEPRIQVAVFGLMGLLGPTRDRMAADAPAVACPVLFIQQWDDSLIPRARVFELFDALGSRRQAPARPPRRPRRRAGGGDRVLGPVPRPPPGPATTSHDRSTQGVACARRPVDHRTSSSGIVTRIRPGTGTHVAGNTCTASRRPQAAQNRGGSRAPRQRRAGRARSRPQPGQ